MKKSYFITLVLSVIGTLFIGMAFIRTRYCNRNYWSFSAVNCCYSLSKNGK